MRVVVFDLDGTLIDSLPDIVVAANHVLAARGLAALPPARIIPMIGDGAKMLLERAFAARDAVMTPADLTAFVDIYTAHSADHTRPYPGIADALKTLSAAGHRLAVCTNKPEAAARAVLRHLGLDGYFEVVTGGDTTPYRKPDPRHLAATLHAMGIAGGRDAVMVGDHDNDVAAAAGLGVPAIFVAWGYGDAKCPYVAQTAAALPAIIARLDA